MDIKAFKKNAEKMQIGDFRWGGGRRSLWFSYSSIPVMKSQLAISPGRAVRSTLRLSTTFKWAVMDVFCFFLLIQQRRPHLAAKCCSAFTELWPKPLQSGTEAGRLPSASALHSVSLASFGIGKACSCFLFTSSVFLLCNKGTNKRTAADST